MIHYEVFPYLDYESRVTANALLPPQDRLSMPLKKDCILVFELHLYASKGYQFATAMREPGSKLAISRRYMNFGRTVNELFFPCQYNGELRKSMVNVLTGFLRSENARYQGLSPYVKKNLPPLVLKQLESLETKYPFIREVTLIRKKEWTPITGHSPHPCFEAER